MSDYEKFQVAWEKFKAALMEHHPFFKLARRVLDWIVARMERGT